MMTLDKATFAGGCFWHVEATFRKVKGVVSTRVGYIGGRLENPTYKDVCTDRTRHAEAIEVEYDSAVVAYDDLLSVFWDIHDPTTVNRQGPDVGSQYRSVIFYHSPGQKAAALASKERLQATDRYRQQKIITEIVPATAFYPAEDYHQRYFEKRGMASCRICGTA